MPFYDFKKICPHDYQCMRKNDETEIWDQQDESKVIFSADLDYQAGRNELINWDRR